MRAWRYTAYGPVEQVLRLVDLPRPTPGAGEVLVRVRHAAINPLDWKLAQGEFRLIMKSRPPCGVGTEFAGDVAELGPGAGDAAGHIKPGQAVVGWIIANRRPPGALADYVALPATQVVPLPEGADPALASTLPVAGVSALQLCRIARVQRGTRLLVHGAAGGVGSATVQWARQLGAQVTATGSAGSQAYLAALGADRVVDHAQTSPAGAGAQPASRWGAPFDAVIDCVAKLAAADLAALLPQGGRAVATLPRFPGMVFDPLLNPLRGIKRYALMLSITITDVELLLRALRDGQLVPRLSERFTLDDAGRALLLSRQGHVRGKLVVDVVR